MLYMGLDTRKTDFGFGNNKGAAWSAPLLFVLWKVSYLNMLQAKFQFSSYFLYIAEQTGLGMTWSEIHIM